MPDEDRIQALKRRKLQLARQGPPPPDDVPPPEELSAVREAASNIGPSAKAFARNIYTALRHPIQTARGVGSVVAGGISKAIPGEQESEEVFDLFYDMLAERFGGAENLEQTFREDPVGLMADLSLVLGGIGGTLNRAGKAAQATKITTAAKAGAAVSKTGAVISKTGKLVDPVGGTGTAIKALVQARAPINSLVKTALQLPKKTGLQRSDELATAFLEKGLTVNRKSLRKLDTAIKESQSDIRKMIDRSTREGVEIATDDILRSLDDLVKNASKEGLELPDLRVLERMRRQFAEQKGLTMTTQEAQAWKQGFNKGFKPDMESRFGQVRSKVRDQLRKTTKEMLEELHPGLKELNKSEGVAIELQEAISNAIVTFEKRPTIAVKGLVAGGIASAVGAGFGDLGTGLKFGAAALVAEKLISNPKIQIAVAHAIHKSHLAAAKAGQLHKVTRPAFQAGRVSEPLPPDEVDVDMPEVLF
jgi:hypothetical protein